VAQSDNPADILRLPLSFDPVALRADLALIAEDRWIPHFNTNVYDGEWSGVALRGPADAVHPIQELVANPGTEAWANTSLHDECSYFAEVMAAFRCPLLSVRLLRLGPGAIIREHTDNSLAFADGDVRIHVPVQTSDEVRFRLDGRIVPLQAGETWYLNVNRPHCVENRGIEHRVHLVLDCTVNAWLLEQAGYPSGSG